MIYELTNSTALPAFPNPFAFLPPVWLGLALMALFIGLGFTYLWREQNGRPTPARVWGIPTPLGIAIGLYTGLFTAAYQVIDEVSINLEHPYNLLHHGRFSMSPEAWVDGTVEPIFYLLHTPFAWTQSSLITANFLISFLVGLGHILIAARLFDRSAEPVRRMLQLGAIALCTPLVTIFATGFGNGLVSLLGLLAFVNAIEQKERRSLLWAAMLPLLRPDAIYLSVVNVAVIAWKRRLRREHLWLAVLPVAMLGAYVAAYWALYGHAVPTPVQFKATRLSMLGYATAIRLLVHFVLYSVSPFHLIGIAILVQAALYWRRHNALAAQSATERSIWIYALAVMPLFFFYSVTQSAFVDFSFYTFSRYWLIFEFLFAILVVTILTDSDHPLGRFFRHPMVAMVIVVMAMWQDPTHTRGRNDSAFAGSFTQRVLPADLTLATTEMNTFGLMVDRPLEDLWGYSTPAIAASNTCNQDWVRNDPTYFIRTRPQVYWPYWFTPGIVEPDEMGTFEKVEHSFSTFHHTSRKSNLLGEMTAVLAGYDTIVVQVHTEGHAPAQIAYLVRHDATARVLGSLQDAGFGITRQREFDWGEFHRHYDPQRPVQHYCG